MDTKNDSHDPVANILSRLRGVAATASGYKAHCPCPCPGHGPSRRGDRNQNLAVSTGRNGAALIYCFAGCHAEDILGCIGLERRHLHPTGSRRDHAGGSASTRGPRPPG